MGATSESGGGGHTVEPALHPAWWKADINLVEPVVGIEIARARRRMWGVTFTVLGALSVVLVYVTTSESAGFPRPAFLPSRTLLTIGLIGSLVVFSLYVFDTERKVRLLSGRLIEEQLAARRMQAEQA